MAELSKEAQAVLDAAFTLADNLDRDVTEAEMIAASLRAAADQVVPEKPSPKYPDSYEFGSFDAQLDARSEILAIADELETQA
jgi:hypothetical protein